MKRILCMALALAAAVCLSTPVFAGQSEYTDKDNGFSVVVPDGFTLLTRSNLTKNSSFLERLGYSPRSFRSKMQDSDIFMYAADRDNRYQIQVRVWESDFSAEIGQLTNMRTDQLADALELIGQGVAADDATLTDRRISRVGDQVYLSYTVKVDQAFCYIEDLTVAGGKCYALLYYNSSPELAGSEKSQHDRILSSLSISRRAIKGGWSGGYNFTLRVLCAALVLAAAVVAVKLISGFVKDIKQRRSQPETIPDRIKMRRK